MKRYYQSFHGFATAHQTLKFTINLIASQALVAATFSTSPAHAKIDGRASSEISATALEEHWRFLSADELRGRDEKSTEFDIAARHVAAAMASAGLEPAGTDGWTQPVPLWTRKAIPGHTPFLDIDGRRYSRGVYAAMELVNRAVIEGPVVFAGYGLANKVVGLNDYSNLDVKGKIVLAFGGVPNGVRPELAYEKADAARDRGAIAFLDIALPESRNRVVDSYPAAEGSRIEEPPPNRALSKLTIPLEAARSLFENSGADFDKLLAKADRHERLPSFALKKQARLDADVEESPYASENILGAIPGTDLAREVVLVTAHLDHLGAHVTSAEPDTIYNGAMDNAIGVSLMLEIARSLASGPRPRRTILFVATTAEEDGLLGARYLAMHPLPSGGRPVAVVNLDMPILTYDFTDIRFIGAQESQLSDTVAAVAKRYGVSSAGLGAQIDWFERSDQWPFVQKGVPAIFSAVGPGNGGTAATKDFFDNHYHKPSDDGAIEVDWATAKKFAEIHRDIIAEVANAPHAPLWYADSQIGKSYAPDFAKAQR